MFCHLYNHVADATAGPDDDDGAPCGDLPLPHAFRGSESDNTSRARGFQVLRTGQFDDVAVRDNAHVSGAGTAKARNVISRRDLGDAGADSKHSAGEVGAWNRRHCSTSTQVEV